MKLFKLCPFVPCPKCASIGCDWCHNMGEVPADIDDNTKAIVVFYRAHYDTQTLTEMGRTSELPFHTAIDIYANTPNPASQIVRFNTDIERDFVLDQLQQAIEDRDFLTELFDQI